MLTVTVTGRAAVAAVALMVAFSAQTRVELHYLALGVVPQYISSIPEMSRVSGANSTFSPPGGH